MRVGYNPHKDQVHQEEFYIHQVIIPVFIPHDQDYYRDAFKILQRCIESMLATSHERTFFTIVNNGSHAPVAEYLDLLLAQNKIHELIHTHNIGKLNAIFKGLCGNNIELVTIADSDVLFLSGWQLETNRVFAHFPRAGVVGIVPQYRIFLSYCNNAIFDTFFSSQLKWLPVKNPEALKLFYKSLGWDDNANPDYLKLSLGFELTNGFKAYLGSGHFVATYKKQMFDEIVTYLPFKMGGDSETYLDTIPLKKDYWRMTTYDNYAYHMGNVYESWMDEISFSRDAAELFQKQFPVFQNRNKWMYFIKNHFFKKFMKSKKFRMLFYSYKGLPKGMVAKY